MMAGECSIHKPKNLDTSSEYKFKKQDKITCSSVFGVAPAGFWEIVGTHLQSEHCFPMVGEMGNVSYPSGLAHLAGIKVRDSALRNSIDTRTRIDIDCDIQALEQIYKFRNRDAVRAFLMEDPSATRLLSEAYGRIRKYFPDSEIFMEVVTDPDFLCEKELVVSIVTDLSPREAIKRLDAFDEDWWLDASDRSRASICIKVEYK